MVRSICAAALAAAAVQGAQAQSNPLLLQLKTLDVEKARIEKWDGRYPQWWMAGNTAGGPNLLFQVPTPSVQKN